MDGRQFDAISRTLANRTTRRGAIRAGGAGAALAGFFGFGRAGVNAQDNDLGGDDFTQTENGIQPDGSCQLYFEANVRVGPSSEDEQTSMISGLLKLNVGQNGGIDDSRFEQEDGSSYPVSGQASGRSISLRILIDEMVLTVVGVSEYSIRSCSGEMGGPATGPLRGDIGDWIAYPVGGGDGQTPIASVTPGATATTGSNAQPTPTVDCSGVFCDGALIPNPETCECYCPGTECGPVCCPSGFVCNNASTGDCSCPSGSYFCGESCVECGSGQEVDYNTCTCHEACASGAIWCNDQCVTCSSGQTLDYNTCTCVDPPCPQGQDLCNGVCTSIVTNIEHCGACNNACPPGMPCISTYCACPPGYFYCAGQQACLQNGQAC
ncbi:MAG: hypothetical protein R2845_05900 [Thermomicrobiales bacterium]